MKNNKGFTLIEIIGTIIILGILAVITIPMFTKNLAGFRDDYYVNIENTVKNSGNEFFNDNRKYRPNRYLESAKVSLATLEGRRYLDDEVLDYEGNVCSKEESYVIVIRKSRDVYDYHVCLKCLGDDYDSAKNNKYCNWSLKPPSYTIGDTHPIYIYKGTDRDTLREEASIPVSVVKEDESGNIIDIVSGEGDDVPYIYPSNIDTVDTNKTGEYPVIYEYGEPKDYDEDGKPILCDEDDQECNYVVKESTVIVYENAAPDISITKTNNVYKDAAGNTEDVSVDYGSGGSWAQQLTISFDKGEGKYAETGTNAAKYQWKRGNKWIDFCTSVDASGKCTITIGKKSNQTIGNDIEMNENVQFRIIDTKGNISLVTSPYHFMIDNTNPGCSIKTPAYTGTGDWFNIDVDVSIIDILDSVGSDSAAVSGIKYYTIDGNEVSSRTTVDGTTHGTSSGVQGEDTSGTMWYGFVEDNAQNHNVCSKNIKRDTVNPGASWTPEATEHDNDSGISVTATCTDALSGPTTPIYSKTETVSSPTTSSGTTVSISCTDKAGNSATLSQTYKVRHHYSSDCSRCGAYSCPHSSCGSYCSSYGTGNTIFTCGACSGDGYTIRSLGTCMEFGCDDTCCKTEETVCTGYSYYSCEHSDCGCRDCWAYQ